MKNYLHWILIILLFLVLGFFIYYCFFGSAFRLEPSDQNCQSDDDCIMAMVKCSCDCGVPINKLHWQKYLDRQEIMCKFYNGPMCDMKCGANLKCIDGLCKNLA